MALQLSRLDGTQGFRIDGIDAYDRSGYSVAGAGDVNGDGVDDLIIGVPRADPDPNASPFSGPGVSYVVFGASDGFGASFDLAALDGANGFRVDGIDANDRSGYSVAGAGDVNGDGLDDVIIGARDASPDGTLRAGESYVVFGSTTGFAASLDLVSLDGANGFRLDGIDREDYSGDAVAGAGDVNGDGIDDLIIGAYGAEPGGAPYANFGASYVVFGTTAGFAADIDLGALDGADGFRIDGGGSSVAGAGDVNGDGVDDLIIGAPAAAPGGASYVVFGTTAGFAASVDLGALNGTDGFRLLGTESGSPVAGAGDINGDGVDDLIIGGGFDDAGAGASYVVFGRAAGFASSVDLSDLDGANGFRIDGIDGDFGGVSVAGAGDVNGDGLDDLIIGGIFGKSHVVFGSAAGFAASLDLATLDAASGIRIDGGGQSVAGAGDVNDDGLDDLIIGAPAADASYVVFGSTQWGGTNDAPIAADDALSVGSRRTADLAGDNGAGYDGDPDLGDLTVTAIAGTPVTTGDRVTLASGLRVTVLGATEVRFDAPSLALGTSFSDSFVYEISDGRGGTDTATVSVDYRQDALDLAGLDGATGFRLDGIDEGDGSGVSVAGAGDVNGDGLDDLIIGAPGAGLGGASYVVFGTTAGFAASFDLSSLDGANGFRLDGVTDDTSGNLVAGAGDINGDGVDDLIVRGQFPTYGGSESYVVFGSAAGFAPSFDLATLDGANGFRLDGVPGTNTDSVAGAGDVNGDGFDDLIVGAPDASSFDGSDGGSYVVFGSAAGFAASLDLAALDGVNGFHLGVTSSFRGATAAGAGDINGDGVDDLIIGSSGQYPGVPGVSYVVFGSPAGFPPSFDLATLDGANGFRLTDGTSGAFGDAVAGAGDVNGDGIDDLVIGGGGVVFGSTAGFAASLDLAALDGANGFRLEGGGFREAVAGAGDFNGDGVDDLIIGGGGESYVVFGSASGFAASIDLTALDGAVDGFRLDSIDEGDGVGGSVAGAGDVNGDGLDDLIVGAFDADPGGRESAGESYVVFGFRTGGTGATSAAVAAPSDDAEQRSACARVVSCSPELEIGETAAKLVGLRFTGLEVPDGATVTGAYIELEAAASDAGASRIAIALEDTTSAATYGRCAGRISARPYLDETTAWSPEAWVQGETYRTADLAATISALIGTEGLGADDALAFRFKGEGEREAAAFESAGAAPKLVISFETDAPASPVASVDDLAGADGFPEAPPDRSSAGSWDFGLT